MMKSGVVSVASSMPLADGAPASAEGALSGVSGAQIRVAAIGLSALLWSAIVCSAALLF